jgi:hypothetical protein
MAQELSTPALNPDTFMAAQARPPAPELNPDTFMASQGAQPIAAQSAVPQPEAGRRDPAQPKAYNLLPDPGTPTAQSRWTRTPIFFGATADAPEGATGYSDYDANKGQGLITVNPGEGSLAHPVNQAIARHESVHMLLHQAFADYSLDQPSKRGNWQAVLNDPAVKLQGDRVLKIMHANGYRGESDTELPAYMAVFSNADTEWTKGVPVDLRNKYIAAFARALAKQNPQTAAKYLRMSAGAPTGEGPTLNPPDFAQPAQPSQPGAAADRGRGLRAALYVNPNTPRPRGMVASGNTDLKGLPVIDNGEGSYSTVYSTSFTDERKGSPTFGKDVLVRGILNGKKTDDVNALKQEYYRTGKHLGVFEPGTPDQYRTQTDPATVYGTQLHNDWAGGKIPGVQMPRQPAARPGLPDPDAVTAQTTIHANNLARLLLTGQRQPPAPVTQQQPQPTPAPAQRQTVPPRPAPLPTPTPGKQFAPPSYQIQLPEQQPAPPPMAVGPVMQRVPGTETYRDPRTGSYLNVPGSKPEGEQIRGGGPTFNAPRVSPIRKGLQTPIIKPEDIDELFPFLVGPFRLHAAMLKEAAAMTSPENALIMAGTAGLGAVPGVTAKIASAGLSTYFATQAGKALLQKYPQIKERVKAKDWQGALELGGAALVDAAMFYGAGKHALDTALIETPREIALKRLRAATKAKTAPPEPTADTTGTEPYRPPAEEPPAKPAAAPTVPPEPPSVTAAPQAAEAPSAGDKLVEPVRIERGASLSNPDEQAMRERTVSRLESDPESHLSEYTKRFGNVLNADNAATLFDEYNGNPGKYRVAVHPAAQWIRDELFKRAIARPAPEGGNRVVFTAGGNASGKSSALTATGADTGAHVVLDSTLSNGEHAERLVDDALKARKAVTILYVNRPLDASLKGMIERAGTEGRVVTINQLIRSQRGAAETVQGLWREYGSDPRVTFHFLNNAVDETTEGGIKTAIPEGYTENRRLNELLNAEYKAGRISEETYRRIRGPGGEPVEPGPGGDRGGPGGGGPQQAPPSETERPAAEVQQPGVTPPSDEDETTPTSGRRTSVPKNPAAGGTPPPIGDISSVPSAAAPAPPVTDRGPVTLGMGFGAFEPFLRESIEDMKAMKAKRDAALEELERSKITPGEKHWGEQVRRYFTGERDLWAARANQGIAKVRKLTRPSRNRRTGVDTLAEAILIAREYKGRPEELRSVLGGYHPTLTRHGGTPAELDLILERLQALRPAIERALAPMDATMKAVDQFYTNMAEMTGAEGKRVGNLETTWNPETYVPHVLNPKGEGAVPGLRKKVGQAMGGRIGKYFGFSQERSFPTLLDAIMNGIVPKTMNIHDAFTIQQDHFARSRATRLLEDQLRSSNIGKYTVQKNAPEGSVVLAPQANEFRQLIPYDTGEIDEQGQPVLETAEKRLYVPKFIEEALRPITSPDFTTEILAVHALRVSQAATKAAQLGLSFFHATTENYMALANMGVKGYVQALRASRDSPEFLVTERDMIHHGGTTSIQGNTVEAYQGLQPGSIPTWGDIWRQNAAVKIMDQAAHAISDFTFANMQRRFKVTDYQLHLAGWMAEHPGASPAELRLAKQGIADQVNAVYGGLHWENIGLNKATVEIARAIMLAPDWTISNFFNVKYAGEGGLKATLHQAASGVGLRRAIPQGWEGGPAGKMARMFWIRTLVGGLVATQAASLMFSGKMSKRPTMVYMGKDPEGREVYQNIFFKGAPGDVTNLVTNIYDYGLQGIARSIAGKGAPVVRTGIQLIGNRDYLGHEIAPKGMNPLASSARTVYAAGKSMLPVPLSLTNQIDMLFGPKAHQYSWPERLATMFAGNPPTHVAPAGTHMSGGVLRPNTPKQENSIIDQIESGQVYKSRRAR